MIEKTIDDWHRHLKGELPGGLDTLLADDVVFYSPIVFTPQKGKDITKLYLNAAAGSLGGDADPEEKSSRGSGGDETKFRYTKKILSGNEAMLEFETSVGGKFVNGVDIITCNDEGKIIEFRVMIRPLQAVNLVHKQMAAMLEKMKSR